VLIALHILLGVLFGAAFVLAARRLAPGRELTIYAAGLFAAALVYAAFAVAVRAPGAWLAVEFAGLVVFTLLALPGLKGSPLPLALGWAAHALWDLLLHSHALTHAGGADVHIVPGWYRLLCAGFDFALAAYLLSLSRRAPATADPR
jgi:hypothetical protein